MARDEKVGPEGRFPAGPKDRLFLLSLTIFFVSLLAMASLGRSWTLFRLIHSIWYMSYIATIYLFIRSTAPERLWSLGALKLSLIFFFFALVLHVPFLLQDPLLSQDIMRMSIRGEAILDGSVPYRDFEVNKPPLYIWMVGGISYMFGPSAISFRIVFSIVNSVIPVLLLWIGRCAPRKRESDSALPVISWNAAAFAYMLWPVALLEVGLAGHFDPVAVVLSLMGFYMFLRRRYVLSGIFLGAGMALKLYPIFIVPAVVLAMERWSDRFKHIGAFIAVPIAASIPILLIDPSLVFDYLFDQTGGWGSAMSVRYLLDEASSFIGLSSIFPFILMSLLMLIGAVYLNMRGVRDRIVVRDTFPAAVLAGITSLMAIGYSALVLKAGVDGPGGMALGIPTIIVSFFFLFLSLFVYVRFLRRRGTPWKLFDLGAILEGHTKIRHLPLIISSVLLLLVTTSPQFHAWYLLWVMPFALTAHPSWAWFSITIFGALQVNVYPPWELSSF